MTSISLIMFEILAVLLSKFILTKTLISIILKTIVNKTSPKLIKAKYLRQKKKGTFIDSNSWEHLVDVKNSL
jgi:Holliday junction resolvasome RuvABC ATP-dependent DNA helicase subunit